MNYHSILSTITLSLLFISAPTYTMNFNFLNAIASSVKEQAITIWCGQKSLAKIKEESFIIGERICISLCNLSKTQQEIKNPNQKLTISTFKTLNESFSTEIKNFSNHIDTFKEYIKTYDTSIKNRDSERIQNLDTVQKYITTANVKHIDIEKLRSYIYKVVTITDFRVDKIDKKEPLDNSTMEPFENYIKQNESAIENTIENIDIKKSLNESTLNLNDQAQAPCISTINANNTNKPNIPDNQEKAIEHQPADLITYINQQKWDNNIKIYCLQLLWVQNKKTHDNRKLFADALETYQLTPPCMIHENWKKPIKYQFVMSDENFETSFNNIKCNDELFESLKKSFNTQIKNIETIKTTIKDIENQLEKSTSIPIRTWQQYLCALKAYYKIIKNDKTDEKIAIENKIDKAIKNIQSTTEGIKNTLLEKNIKKEKISINEWNSYLNALKACFYATQNENETKELNKKIVNTAKIIKRKKIKENIKPIKEKIQKDFDTHDKVMLSVAETYLSQLIKLKKLTPKKATTATKIEEDIKDIKLKIAKRIEEKELEPLIDFYIKNTGAYSIAIFNDNIDADFNKLNSYEPNNLSSKVFDQKHLKTTIENIQYNLNRIKEINEEIKKYSIFIDKPHLNFHYFIHKVNDLRTLLPTEQLPHKSSLYDKLINALKKMTSNIKTATFLPIMSPMQLEEDLKESIDFFNEYKGIKKEDATSICTILEEYKKDNYYTKLDSLIKKYENNDTLLNNNKEELKSDLTALENYKNKYQKAAPSYSAATTDFFKKYLDPIDKTIKKINQHIDMLLSIDQQNTTLNIIEKKNIEQDTIQNKILQSTEQDNSTENKNNQKAENVATEKDETKNNIPTVEEQNKQQKSIVSQSTEQKKSEPNESETNVQEPKKENTPEPNVVPTTDKDTINQSIEQNNSNSTIVENQKQPKNNIPTVEEQNKQQKSIVSQSTEQKKSEPNESETNVQEPKKENTPEPNVVTTNEQNRQSHPASIEISQSTEQKNPDNPIVRDQKQFDNNIPSTNVVPTISEQKKQPSIKIPTPETPIKPSSSWMLYIGSIFYSPIGGLRYLLSSFLKLFWNIF